MNSINKSEEYSSISFDDPKINKNNSLKESFKINSFTNNTNTDYKKNYAYLKLANLLFNPDVCSYVINKNANIFEKEDNLDNIIDVLIDKIFLAESDFDLLPPDENKQQNFASSMFSKSLTYFNFSKKSKVSDLGSPSVSYHKQKESNFKKSLFNSQNKDLEEKKSWTSEESINEKSQILIKSEFCEDDQDDKNEKKPQKPQKKQKIDKILNKIVCQICLNDSEDDNLQKICKLSCEHEFCSDCMYEYLKNEIQNGQVLKISCPDYTCENNFTEDEVKEYVKCPLLFYKYKKFKRIKEISQDPSVCWCIKPGCEQYSHGSDEDPKIICSCGYIYCFKCRNNWHEGISCELALENEINLYSKNKFVKNCPNCKSRIEKNGGCNHMQCINCDFDFCWLCMKKYTKGHYGDLNLFGCPGRMYVIEERNNFGKSCSLIYMIFKRIFIFVVLIVELALMILLSPLLSFATGIWFFKHIFSERTVENNCCCIFFLVLLFYPFFFVATLFPGIFFYLFSCVND